MRCEGFLAGADSGSHAEPKRSAPAGKGSSGRVSLRPQRDNPAATVD